MKKDNLRKRVFESALQIVESEGMELLSVRKLAKQSSCSLGSIYNAFGSFQDLQLHINANILTKLYLVLDESAEKGIKENKPIRAVFKDMAYAYIEFGQKNRFLWKALFEHFPYEPVPEWYSKHVGEGIFQISDRFSTAFEMTEAHAKQILGFFWAAIHGVSSILLNKKMEMSSELFTLKSLHLYVEYCLEGLFNREPAEQPC